MRELAYLWVLRRAAEGSQICDFREAKVDATLKVTEVGLDLES